MVDVPRFGTDSFSVGLSLNYAHKPLVLGVERATGEFQTLRVLIEHQLLGQLDLAASLCNCGVFSLSLPIALVERGDSSNGSSSSPRSWSPWATSAVRNIPGEESSIAGTIPLRGVGAREPRLGMLLRLYGQPDTTPFSASAGGYLWLPLRRMLEGTAPHTSDEEFRVMPRLVLAGYSHPLQWSLTGSFLYRPEARQGLHPALGGDRAGSELGLGARVSYTDKQRGFSLGPEAQLMTVVIPRDQAFKPFYTSLEVLLGLQFKVGQTLQVGLAAGAGLMRQLGTPAFRFMVRVSSTSTLTPQSEGHQAPAGLPREKSGVSLSVPVAVPLPMSIPLLVEVSPEAPADGASEPETSQDESPGDRDHDTVTDAMDACPDQPGAPSMESSRSGCPGLVAVKNGMLLLQRPITFARNTDVVLDESFPVLQAIADALRASPWLQKIRIEGHTDSQGPTQVNNSLSIRRAHSVMRWLQKDGIHPARMEAAGHGPSRPIAVNDSEQGRAANRRVDIVIIDPPAARADDERS
ncbi:OmpA family protein [Archangium sp.]|jgi:outer membrane protein OmpA-like peptidoglycan-associated protein|uniref:OmpA family protein n=1 Tax=Archangium sp. TaxID=1872627 RepID=UPI002EDBAD24